MRGLLGGDGGSNDGLGDGCGAQGDRNTEGDSGFGAGGDGASRDGNGRGDNSPSLRLYPPGDGPP